ncbi:DUF2141 domain-containing protein [Noviherbaspirillum sp. 17J57-3]|uniref:DUF2141 domain-containing protein n=2 Tax=Noviherbaspirillum galbum TaxID=2709383 RepID=A0A6B3SRZ8_9BURK|nr:DUF2141 domain-containing protein [Noviherbaspirillum galbum]
MIAMPSAAKRLSFAKPFSALLALATFSCMAADLTVVVKGKGKGEYFLALHDTTDSWMTGKRPFRLESGTYQDGIGINIKDVPAGEYAVSLFIDENGNKALDKYPIGLPREPYGFSRDAFGWFGPPGFKDAAFELRTPAMSTTINLR